MLMEKPRGLVCVFFQGTVGEREVILTLSSLANSPWRFEMEPGEERILGKTSAGYNVTQQTHPFSSEECISVA